MFLFIVYCQEKEREGKRGERKEDKKERLEEAVMAGNWRCLAAIRGRRAITLPGVFPLQVISSCTFHSIL